MEDEAKRHARRRKREGLLWTAEVAEQADLWPDALAAMTQAAALALEEKKEIGGEAYPCREWDETYQLVRIVDKYVAKLKPAARVTGNVLFEESMAALRHCVQRRDEAKPAREMRVEAALAMRKRAQEQVEAVCIQCMNTIDAQCQLPTAEQATRNNTMYASVSTRHLATYLIGERTRWVAERGTSLSTGQSTPPETLEPLCERRYAPATRPPRHSHIKAITPAHATRTQHTQYATH
jgi:hypothetical protein